MDPLANGSSIYFAYGSNMLTRRLKAQSRAPSAKPLGTGFVLGRKLTFNKKSNDKSGKCDAEVSKCPADRVFGVLFQVEQADWATLDKAEACGKGYDRTSVEVVTSNGVVRALTYVATSTDAGLQPYHWYKALVIAGALEHGLPAEYIELVRCVHSAEDTDNARRVENETVLLATTLACASTIDRKPMENA